MPEIGLGINGEKLEAEMKKLAIKPERIPVLMEVLTNIVETFGEDTPIDMLKKLIRTTTKANELAISSFTVGLLVGTYTAVSAMGSPKPTVRDMLEKAVVMGATHAEEVKQHYGITDETPAATAAKKKSAEKEEEERMYG